MKTLPERTSADPSPTGLRVGRVAKGIAIAIGVLVGIIAVLFAVSWVIPESEVEGALTGPVGFMVAMLVGATSFFTPCVLPLLPGYLSFVSGLSGEDIERGASRRRVVAGTTMFTLGFSAVFAALGAVASGVGGWLNTNISTVNRFAGVFVIVMGLAFLVPSVMRFLEVERRPLLSKVQPGVGGAFPLGVAYAIGWSPCVGPGLGVMLSLGFVEGTVARGALLLFFFGIGFGMWFMLGGLAMRRALSASGWLRRNTRVLQAVGGTFMLAIGVLLVTDQWERLLTPLQSWLNQVAPWVV